MTAADFDVYQALREELHLKRSWGLTSRDPDGAVSFFPTMPGLANFEGARREIGQRSSFDYATGRGHVRNKLAVQLTDAEVRRYHAVLGFETNIDVFVGGTLIDLSDYQPEPVQTPEAPAVQEPAPPDPRRSRGFSLRTSLLWKIDRLADERHTSGSAIAEEILEEYFKSL